MRILLFLFVVALTSQAPSLSFPVTPTGTPASITSAVTDLNRVIYDVTSTSMTYLVVRIDQDNPGAMPVRLVPDGSTEPFWLCKVTPTPKVKTHWTFRPFRTLKEAQIFMDSLPDTAGASFYKGKIRTAEEQKNFDDYNREEVRLEAERSKTAKERSKGFAAAYHACRNSGKSNSDCQGYLDQAVAEIQSTLIRSIALWDFDFDRFIVNYKEER